MADVAFSGTPKYAFLWVVMSVMPTSTFLLGLVGDVVVMADFIATGCHGCQTYFIVNLIFFLLPCVLLLVATLIGIEKAEDDDPAIVKNNKLVSALYFAFHAKVFYLYIQCLVLGLKGLCGCAPKDPRVECPPKIGRAGTLRRWIAYLNSAPCAVFQAYVLFTRVVRNNGKLGTNTTYLQFGLATSVFALTCAMLGHHKADPTVPFDTVYSAPHRFLATFVCFAWKVLLCLGRVLTLALFLYTFGELLAIPIVVHGVAVLIVFIIFAKPVTDSVYAILRVVILSYSMNFDVNDPWVNELKGTKIVTIAYYVLHMVFTIALIIPSYIMVNAPDVFRNTVTITVFVTWVGGLGVRLLYFLTPLYPKSNADEQPC